MAIVYVMISPRLLIRSLHKYEVVRFLACLRVFSGLRLQDEDVS